MKRMMLTLLCTLSMSLAFESITEAASAKLPTIGGKAIVATVNGEPVTHEEFRKALASLHEGIQEKDTGRKKDYSGLLDRIINAKLILQEARNIGLDTLPEVKKNVGEYEIQVLRELLLSRQIRDIRPKERDVQKVYKESVREWKIRSYLFEKEEDAKQAEGALLAGAAFDNVMNRLVAEGKAKGDEEGSYFKGKDLLPEIAQAVSKLKEGDVSPSLKIPTGKKGEFAFTFLKLEGVRYPEDPEALKRARKEVLQKKRLESLDIYAKTLKKKYVKIHQGILDNLDYESKDPGLDNLVKDPRVVAEILGEKPIRVADMSLEIKQKFYHGVELAAAGKKVNKLKAAMLDEMILKRVLQKEALREKIDKKPEFKGRIASYRNEVVFEKFVEKVIDRDIKPDEKKVRKYYDERGEEFLSPEMIRVSDLVFGKREDAADAMEKLRKGADYKWLKANAPGQIEEKSRQRVAPLVGELVPKKDLPDEVQEAVSGAGPGEVRLYASPENQYFVLDVLEVVPPKPVPFDQVKDFIASKVFQEERQKSVEEWAGKLRAASEIKIFATRQLMERYLTPSAGTTAKP